MVNTYPSLISKTPEEREQNNQLIARKVPHYRQAYSDRTAWLMACLSELAYLRFNPLFKNALQEKLFERAVNSLEKEPKLSKLSSLISDFGYDPEEELARLKEEVGELKLELEATFDTNGTQAILVSGPAFLVLAFRGTETTSPKDIKTDVKGVEVPCETGGKIHKGFKEAYEEVAGAIAECIGKEKYFNRPLFITGHSLGGALATIAAKRLKHSSGIAACYTYGAPRVGNTEWAAGLKTPVYRLVNAADCVPMMPPSRVSIDILSYLFRFIPTIGRSVSNYLTNKFGGYIHAGDMRYLTNCTPGDYNEVELLNFVSPIYRLKGALVKGKPWSSPLADHSIRTYRKKLAIVARNRNLL